MKRASILVVFVTMLGLGSCTSFSRQLELKTDIDTLSYFWGMARADGVKEYLRYEVGVDTSYMDAFYRGFRDGAKNYSPKEVAYLEGKRIAQMMNTQMINDLNYDIFMGDSGQTVNRKLLLAGLLSGIKNQDLTMIIQAQTYSQMKIDSVKDDFMRTKYAVLIADGEKLLADNKNKTDIKITESGLQYKIITEGAGPIPDNNARVKVHFRGKLVDGSEFDSSFKNDAPSSIHINGVIKGFSEALKMMPVGSKWELYIPHDLAYGPAGQIPNIPPYATLIFEVELLEIE